MEQHSFVSMEFTGQVDFVAETATDFAFAWKAPGRFTRQPQPQMPQAMGPGLQRELRQLIDTKKAKGET